MRAAPHYPGEKGVRAVRIVARFVTGLGFAAAGAALLAAQIGLDRNPGWGTGRTALLGAGVATVLLGVVVHREATLLAAWVRQAQSRLEGSDLVERLRGINRRWELASPRTQNTVILASFVLFFSLLLLPIPLSGSLLGSVDTLFGPALSNAYLNRLQASLTGQVAAQSMYPSDIARYGESGVGVAGVFMLFRILGANDIYSLYFTQVILFALMAFAAVLFARHYTPHLSLAVFSALVFTTSNFMWANVDDLVIHFYFLPLLSAHFLKTALESRRGAFLLAAGVAGGLQVYLSVQVYVYQTMLLGIILLFSAGAWWRNFSLQEKLLFVAAYLLVPVPRILYYLHTVNVLGVVDAWPISAQKSCYYLQVQGLFSTLPDKLITYPFLYHYYTDWRVPPFCSVRQLAFLGLGLPALALVALASPKRPALELLSVAIVGLLFALGGDVKVGDVHVASPVQLFYQYFPLAKYLRLALRSYSLVVLALSVLAALGLQRVLGLIDGQRRAWRGIALMAALLFILAENVSWPLNRFETVTYPRVPEGYVRFFRDKPDALILDLPSMSESWPGYLDEIIYALWQTKHQRNIVGGVTGYYPPSRLETQKYVDLLPSEEAFAYLRELGVTHLVWHDSPQLYSHPPNTWITPAQLGGRGGMTASRDFSWLADSVDLGLVMSNKVLTVYELRPVPESAEVSIP